MLRAVVNALASEHESAVAGDRDPGDANVAANRATVLKGEDALYAADVALVEQLAHPLPARWPHTVRPQSAGRTRGGVARTARATSDVALGVVLWVFHKLGARAPPSPPR